jgi:hypothetical protein
MMKLSKAWLSWATLPVALLGFGGPIMANPALEARQVTSASNPILSDGQDYTTDPATLVTGGKFYILTGRDTAEPGVNDFIMPEWQMLVTDDPRTGKWTHYPHFLKPDEVFKWATPGRAYAAQIVQGPDKRFYLYAPVMQEGSTNKDGFCHRCGRV